MRTGLTLIAFITILLIPTLAGLAIQGREHFSPFWGLANLVWLLFIVVCINRMDLSR